MNYNGWGKPDYEIELIGIEGIIETNKGVLLFSQNQQLPILTNKDGNSKIDDLVKKFNYKGLSLCGFDFNQIFNEYVMSISKSNNNYGGYILDHEGHVSMVKDKTLSISELKSRNTNSLIYTLPFSKNGFDSESASGKLSLYFSDLIKNEKRVDYQDVSRFCNENRISAVHIHSTGRLDDYTSKIKETLNLLKEINLNN